jgi:hypothetical protein
MNNIEYVRIFNQLVDQFFNELIETFPEQRQIKTRYLAFQTICKANVRKTVIDFMNNSLPYLEKILSKDESFFYGDDKPGILKELKVELWWNSDLSEKTKATMWKYIKSFFAVGIKAVEVPKEYIPIIQYIINTD